MDPGGRPCPCGLQGCLEQYSSGNAILRRAQEVATTSPVLAGDLLERAGGRTYHIEGWMITESARSGDVAALQRSSSAAAHRDGGVRSGSRLIGAADLARDTDPDLRPVAFLDGEAAGAATTVNAPMHPMRAASSVESSDSAEVHPRRTST
jgi:hypothetical protein